MTIHRRSDAHLHTERFIHYLRDQLWLVTATDFESAIHDFNAASPKLRFNDEHSRRTNHDGIDVSSATRESPVVQRYEASWYESVELHANPALGLGPTLPADDVTWQSGDRKEEESGRAYCDGGRQRQAEGGASAAKNPRRANRAPRDAITGAPRRRCSASLERSLSNRDCADSPALGGGSSSSSRSILMIPLQVRSMQRHTSSPRRGPVETGRRNISRPHSGHAGAIRSCDPVNAVGLFMPR
jgi:hypothetical protein